MTTTSGKLFYIFYFILLTLFFQVEKMNASHAMGAELTYECLGGNQYRLTYAFYRDCSGIPAPPSVNVNYTSSCFAGSTVNLVPTISSPTQLLLTCPSATTTCNGGVHTGIEEWIYQAIVTLPGPCSDWNFSYAECCRNASITTVPNISSYELYVFSLLNNVAGDCNNSTVFNTRPVPLACVGVPFCFNNGAYDPDGDSISYQLITPLSVAATPITYDASYSASSPVLSNPPTTFSSLTGDFCLVPTQADVSVFAVLVSEYRNGVLIGQVERDIQIEVSQCTNAIPNMTGIDGTFSSDAVFCAGESKSFEFYSVDGDASQTTGLSWDFGIPGAQFTTSGGQRDTATFSWTPSHAQVSSTPYCFTATVTDNNCPYLGVRTRQFCITVADSTVAECMTNSISRVEASQQVRVFNLEKGNKIILQWQDPASFRSARIFDSFGRILKEKELQGSDQTEFNIENLSSGIYHLRLDGKEHWAESFFRQ
ncbi:MAG: hypothetical protein KA444_05225 [Bacteroidia bacterium]|nr:hypothetical protein [Bacteroidia bacterium]